MTERHDKEMYKSVTVRFSYVDEYKVILKYVQ